MYNVIIPPVIFDGGKEVLLANFYGQRSLKCASQNGGLAKTIPEHTYAVQNAELLFAGFLAPSSPKRALVWGIVVRGFARRDLC